MNWLINEQREHEHERLERERREHEHKEKVLELPKEVTIDG